MIASSLINRLRPWVIVPVAALLALETTQASCTCLCVEGYVQAVCDNPVEPKPLCGPTLCAPAPEIREPEPRVSSPGKEWKYTSPPNTKIGDDSYEWMEVGESPW